MPQSALAEAVHKSPNPTMQQPRRTVRSEVPLFRSCPERLSTSCFALSGNRQVEMLTHDVEAQGCYTFGNFDLGGFDYQGRLVWGVSYNQ